MSDESPCWENTNHPLPERSPFDQVLILGWYDGPEEGLIRCGKCKRVYLFKSLDFVNEDEGLRLFGLAPLPADSIDSVVQALSQYMSPKWPMWAPIWQFPTEAERETVDSLIDGILSKAGPTTLVVTTSNLAEVIQAAKIASAEHAAQEAVREAV